MHPFSLLSFYSNVLTFIPNNRFLFLAYVQAKVATKAEVSAAVQQSLSKFHCDICNKGYANVAQWEEHLLSYGHNHAKRKKEVAMQSRSNKNTADEVNKRREKEKKREQKELERMMKAVGGPSTQTSQATGSSSTGSAAALSAAPKMPVLPANGEMKKGGFFKVATSSQPPPPPTASSSTNSVPPPPPPSSSPAPPPPPPPMADAPSPSLGDRARVAPRFTSSAASSLASTWKGPPTIAPVIQAATAQSTQQYARSWKPTAAPALHPLLAGNSPQGAASPNNAEPVQRSGGWQGAGNNWKNKVKDQRNDLFKRDGTSSNPGFELPTAASSINTSRAPKAMTFVSSSSKPSATDISNATSSNMASKTPSVSLAGTAFQKRRPLDMNADDDEDEEESGMPLPTGRPRAGLPPTNAPGSFRGFRPLGK